MRLIWNEADGRLQPLWRVLVFQALIWGLLYGPVQWIAPVTYGWLARLGPAGAMLGGSHVYILLPVAVLGLLALVCRYADRRSLAERGLNLSPVWWRDLGIAAGIAVYAAGIIFLIEDATGLIHITGYLSSPQGVSFGFAFLVYVLQFIGVGFWEELWFRAHLVPNLKDAYAQLAGPDSAPVLAAATGGLYFGAAHMVDPNWTAGGIAALCVAGTFLGLLYLRSGSVAMPIGFHAAWDIALGPIFGFPVSGDSVGVPKIIAIDTVGSTLWTGGAFGPESGIVGWLVVPIAFVLMWRLGVRSYLDRAFSAA